MEMLVRMFFTDGKTEVRPLDRVHFTTPEIFVEECNEEIPKLVNTINDQRRDCYVVFVNQLNGIQLHKGEFVDVRGERERGRDHSQRRTH